MNSQMTPASCGLMYRATRYLAVCAQSAPVFCVVERRSKGPEWSLRSRLEARSSGGRLRSFTDSNTGPRSSQVPARL